MSRTRLTSLVLYHFLLASSCATWETVGGYYESRDSGFSIDLPRSWHRHLPAKALLITRDGLLLQQIEVGKYQVDKIPFSTNRRLSVGMLPVEVAEVIIDDLRSNQLMLNFRVLGSRPGLVGGYSGFRITYSYQFKDNLPRMGVYDGALLGRSYFFLRFEAPRRHYFERDLPVFEQVSRSLKIGT